MISIVPSENKTIVSIDAIIISRNIFLFINICVFCHDLGAIYGIFHEFTSRPNIRRIFCRTPRHDRPTNPTDFHLGEYSSGCCSFTCFVADDKRRLVARARRKEENSERERISRGAVHSTAPLGEDAIKDE